MFWNYNMCRCRMHMCSYVDVIHELTPENLFRLPIILHMLCTWVASAKGMGNSYCWACIVQVTYQAVPPSRTPLRIKINCIFVKSKNPRIAPSQHWIPSRVICLMIAPRLWKLLLLYICIVWFLIANSWRPPAILDAICGWSLRSFASNIIY